MSLHKKGIQVVNILQAMEEAIQVEEEAPIKAEAINTQVRATTMGDTKIKLALLFGILSKRNQYLSL